MKTLERYTVHDAISDLAYLESGEGDLVQKYNLPDTQALRQLSEFLMDNISNLTSPNRVSDILTANKVQTNHVTIGKYIKKKLTLLHSVEVKKYIFR